MTRHANVSRLLTQIYDGVHAREKKSAGSLSQQEEAAAGRKTGRKRREGKFVVP